LQLLILGSSARAAAFSARRAGLQPVTADLFADGDLRAIAAAHRIAASDYPEALAAVGATVAPSPWIYTGALENHPDLVAQIARQRPLWGNDAPALRAVRDPFALATVLRRAGLPCPAVQPDASRLPRDGSWLVKPLASAGGQGIAPLGRSHDRATSRPCYYQQRIDGPSLAAVFLAARDGQTNESSATLVGVTRQWIGRPGCPFAYAGSLGPWPIAPGVRPRIAALGRTLAAAFRLSGLFGVDLILRDGEPWTVEVNPRYTASVEVLELALRRPLLAEHALACDADLDSEKLLIAPPSPCSRAVGKLILFAPAPCRFPNLREHHVTTDGPFTIPRLADLPDPDTPFEAGAPVLTLFAHGASVAACQWKLRHRVGRWERRLRSCATCQS
jgi:predicted ATP-grasp superfamily ATP-dependent carboligase